MQAQSVFPKNYLYIDGMAGRPANNDKRTPFGQRLFDARSRKGYSQRYMASELGITQPSYADWERRSMAIKPEYLPKLSEILDVSIDYLLGLKKTTTAKGGPIGKTRRVFEEVNDLPRHSQKRIVSVVEELLIAHRAKA